MYRKPSGENIIAHYLKQMGLTPNYQGYRYLCDLAAIPSDSLKELYFVLAQLHQVSYACVERNIRTAIGVIWKYPDHTALDHLFGHHVYTCPKCSEFISAILTLADSDEANPPSRQLSFESLLDKPLSF